MKKGLFILTFVLLSIAIFGQDSIKYVYCELIGGSSSGKFTAAINFGKQVNLLTDPRLKGEDGKRIVFNSMIDGLNYMAEDNWEFVQAYIEPVAYKSTGETTNYFYYILKKKIKK